MYNHLLVIGATSELFHLLVSRLIPYITKFTCIGRNENRLLELKNKYPNHIEVIVLDLMQEASFQAIHQIIRSNDFDGLIQLQGYGIYGDFLDISIDDHIKIMHLNFHSYMRIFHDFAQFQKNLKKKKLIVHAASLAGIVPCAYLASYSAAKAALLHFTKAMELEHLDTFFIQAICPSSFGTEFAKTASKGLYKNSSSVKNYTDQVIKTFYDVIIFLKKKSYCSYLDFFKSHLYPILPKRILEKIFKNKIKSRISNEL